MALEVLTVEYENLDESGFKEHSTVYATRVTGDWYQDTADEAAARHPFSDFKAWRVGDSALWVYPEEVDAYIELLQKIKATATK